MAQNDIPQAIDYTSRDFYSLRNDLIARIQAKLAEQGVSWSATDPADFGVALVEAFAHMGDVANYYIDRVANESYLETATQRENILKIASRYGYIPGGYRRANATLTFSNTSVNPVTIPAGTQLSTSQTTTSGSSTKTVKLLFTLDHDVDIPGADFLQADITAATGNGTTITYTADNSFTAGQSVNITGMSTSAFNLSNAVIATATSSQFTVANTHTGTESTATGTAVSTAKAAGVEKGTVLHGYPVSTLPENAASTTDSTDIAGEFLGSSSGLASQKFTLSKKQIDQGTVVVFVKHGSNWITWNQVQSLSDWSPTDHVFVVSEAKDSTYVITFGDGINGAIPTNAELIKADYIVGGGVSGNFTGVQNFSIETLPATSNTTVQDLIYDNQGNLIISVNSTSDGATGGEDSENNDSIRKNAPLVLQSLDRAVSLTDYASLAIKEPTVGKAASYSSTPTSVALYIAPLVSSTSQDYYPGMVSVDGTLVPTKSWQDMSTRVSNFLADKTQLGINVVISPPVYAPIFIEMEFTVKKNFSPVTVLTELKNALLNKFGYVNIDFDNPLFPATISSTLTTAVEGVNHLNVISLRRSADSTPGANVIKPNMGEIITFISDNDHLHVAPMGTLYRLEGNRLTASFEPSTLTYLLQVPSATTTYAFTPYSVDPDAVIVAKVNSGAWSSAIPSGTLHTVTLGGHGTNTAITVKVTAADGVTSTSYVITVIRP